MNRRSFIAALLAAPAALFALVRPAKTQRPPPLPPSENKPLLEYRFPRATTCYQRLYTKLKYRPGSQGDGWRTVWINGTSANGERDVFYQHQRHTSGGWVPTHTMRYSHRYDINKRVISYPKVRVDLSLEVIPVLSATVPWFKDVVAIARWTETEGRA